jgi:gamma-glutamyltranspeptidase/glutathione hydrolase
MTTRRNILAGAAFGALAATPALAGDRPLGKAFAGRSTVYAKRGMVATSHPLATAAGLEILKAGGSAVDAAIAANACLGLMEPTGCGIGGDLFALVWDPKAGKLTSLNASGAAPRGQTLAQLKKRLKPNAPIPPLGPLPVTIPGAVDGWLAMHAQFGRKSMAEVLAPAIGYARDGFPMAPIIAMFWARNLRRFKETGADAGVLDNAFALYAPNGDAPKAGALFKNPDLADTYDAIAREGRAWFYEGDGAKRMAAYLQRMGGAHAAADFAGMKAQWTAPISTTYRGVQVAQCPPNNQGLTVLQMLNILEGFDLRQMGFGSADALHVATEAKKLAFVDRARFIADPDRVSIPLEELLSKERAARQRAQIKMDRAMPAADIKGFEGGDTIYMCTADESGQMVSLIQSNYRGMGSGLVADGMGFMFQNRGQQFNLDPRHANAYAPGKRPFHTIIPGFALKDGAPWLAFGVMGGAMQPQGHVQIINNLVDFDMDVQEAGDAPRWRHIGGPDPDGFGGGDTGDRLFLESGIDAQARAALASRGHTLAERAEDVGGYQAVQRGANGIYAGASEMRKDGFAAGY